MNKRGLLDFLIVRIPELSPGEKITLLEKFDKEDDFVRFGTVSGIESIIARKLKKTWSIDKIRAQAEQDAKITQIRGIKYVAWNHVEYPPLLREISNPPPVLFYRGNLPDPEKPLVAIVGTRHPSPQAAAHTYDISNELARMGIQVVSGLALGIDSMAHRGNLEGGGCTFAVLGSGADEVYPHSNRFLASRILETGGGFISEYPPGTPPFKSNFPARNRIISGMARGVLIAEAPESSGALITAYYALDHNRDLWVSSFGADASMSGRFDRRGSIKLAENGAKIISRACDILKDWNMEIPPDYYSEKAHNDMIQNNCGRALAEAVARSINTEL